MAKSDEDDEEDLAEGEEETKVDKSGKKPRPQPLFKVIGEGTLNVADLLDDDQQTSIDAGNSIKNDRLGR